jgi:hypothetical protein
VDSTCKRRRVVACLLTGGLLGRATREVRTFGTITRELLALTDWLSVAGCTHVATESMGSYWKPVYNILEGAFELVVVNAQHLRAVPGRKTDVRDAGWIADLLRHGLLRASFIPSRPEREPRELSRDRTGRTGASPSNSSATSSRTASMDRSYRHRSWMPSRRLAPTAVGDPMSVSRDFARHVKSTVPSPLRPPAAWCQAPWVS